MDKIQHPCKPFLHMNRAYCSTREPAMCTPNLPQSLCCPGTSAFCWPSRLCIWTLCSVNFAGDRDQRLQAPHQKCMLCSHQGRTLWCTAFPSLQITGLDVSIPASSPNLKFTNNFVCFCGGLFFFFCISVCSTVVINSTGYAGVCCCPFIAEVFKCQ